MTTTRFFTSVSTAALIALVSVSTLALAQDTAPVDDTTTPVVHGPNFIDENGDGYNDNAPDHDGDGIPNGQDADYTAPQDGTGTRNGQAVGGRGTGQHKAGSGLGVGKGRQNKGAGAGTGNAVHTRLRDGSGAGTGAGRGTGRGAGAAR